MSDVNFIASTDVLVLGGGLAGSQLTQSLREEKFAGSITLVCDEKIAPYHRPPLSKAYLAGSIKEQNLSIRDLRHYDLRGIQPLLDTHAVKVNRQDKSVVLCNGRTIHYDKLVFATGARNRHLLPRGSETEIYYLRTLHDAQALKTRVECANSVTIIGAGFLGLEVAHSIREKGIEVTVIEKADRVLARTSSDAVSRAMHDLHAAAGIRIICGQGINGVRTEAGYTSIELESGETVSSEFIVACIGVVPNTELATSAGLTVDNGIVVNSQLQASDPSVYALGDCALFPSSFDTYHRIESVQNAIDQAKFLAGHLTGKTDHSGYLATPWFWSDQGVRLQIVGLPSRAEKFETRGDVPANRFSIYGFKNNQLVSVESIGRPSDHMAARKILAASSPFTPEMLPPSTGQSVSHASASDQSRSSEP
ncbi:pyridine nucleotide-disulfide oxidoreductase [Candidimonas sp. SYP-B2681]|uniref:NAD(P)/FAD-dependent oxidoreductase n=1 Tax=Candidimonas sp. SYP-B2681 TaxID=2497686 RepID=UPI000F86E9EB|nr:FAD-dependent oxidoreductase [Candidimonas sp. SYP-B2681]RTZ45465.1 pyridine nucleotide-disulfide oxidoreductase [Candidimonas sp. SYP-B2681]